MSRVWPVIVEQIPPLPDADKFNPNEGYTEDKTPLLDQFDKD